MLGPTELVASDGRAAEAILAQPKRLALLAYLCAAQPAGYRRRDELLALFWPDLDEARARSALSQALHRLRLALGKDVLVARGPDEIGVDPVQLACDVEQLHRALAEGRVEDALALYRGDLLPGLNLGPAEFDRWLDETRAALRAAVADAAGVAADRARMDGREASGARFARRAVELAPYDEAGVRRCMELLARTGDLAGAVRCYDDFAARVRRDLDLAPSPETAALVTRLRTAPPAPRGVAEPRMGAVEAAPDGTVPSAPPAGAAAPPHARRRWPVLLVAAAAVAAAVSLARVPLREPPGAAPAADRVLVLPFAVRGDTALSFLREGMVDLLSASVEGLAHVQAVDPHAVLAAVADGDSGRAGDPVRGRALARRLGANAFVIGEVIAIAGRLQVSAVLYDSAGRRAAALASEAPALAGLPDAVDDLARQIVATRLSGPAQRLARLAALTTDSLDALRAYLAGEQLLRRGQFGPAVDAFRAAVAMDTLFPLAWFRLGVALEWVQATSPERRAAVDRALALSPRLTERDRMLVRAYHAYAYGSLAEAEATYRQLVTLYPEDVEAWYGLADVMFHAGPYLGRPITEAEPAFRRLLTLQPDHVEGRLHLARLLARRDDAGARATLDSLVHATLPLMVPEQGHAVRLRALRAFAVGDTAAARGLQPEIAALPELDIWEAGALVATMTGDLAGAARILGALTAPWRAGRWRAIGYLALAHLAVAEGRWLAARGALDDVARLDPTLGLFARAFLSAQPWLPLSVAERDSVRRALAAWTPAAPPGPVLLGVYPSFPAIGPAVRLLDLAALAALMGDSLDAARYADSLRALAPLEAPAPGDWELPATARAAVAARAGRTGAALTALEGLRPSPRASAFPRTFVVTHGLERWLRAESLHGAGRWREALDWYGTFTYYLAVMDIPFEAPAWLRQGAIHEELGERDAARAAYARVLARWRDADPRFAPPLAEARAGLTRVARGP